MSEARLFLIVFLPRAKAWLSEHGQWDGLESALRGLGNIRLYNLPDKKGREKRVVALPLNDGLTLFLKRNDQSDENYFICVGAANFPRSSKDGGICHELPDSVRCRVVIAKKVSSYLREAADCDEINGEVMAKKTLAAA